VSVDDAKKRPPSFGDYQILGHLGEGGMCHVFRARRKGEQHDVALKLLKEERRKDERVLDLFITEADLSLLLHHPNLVETYDAGEVSGRYYIAMELVEGVNLRELVGLLGARGLELPPDLAMFVIHELLEGLEAVHAAVSQAGTPLGLVHRDVTPHNVFLSFDGRIILGDLGIAHVQAYGDVETSTAMGKLGYLSPEQASGEVIDARSDLFAVGVMLHELLTGRRLYEGSDESKLLEEIAEAKAPKLRRLRPRASAELEDVVDRALARRARDRFDSAEAFMVALEPCWSTLIGNPRALAGLMAAMLPDRAQAFHEARSKNRPVTPAPAQSLPPAPGGAATVSPGRSPSGAGRSPSTAGR
jgi:serine/threonine protein kinase